MLHLANVGYCTGDALLRVLGHFNWAVLLRRSLLSTFNACYKFASFASTKRMRLWSECRVELRAAAALVVCARLDTRRPVDSVVASPDASRVSSRARGDFGGYGVTTREMGAAAVWDAAARSERRRYSVEEAISARSQALGDVAPSRLDQLEPELLLPLDAWQTAFAGRWQRPEGILRLEGRALVRALPHRVRALRVSGSVWQFVCDNMSVVLAVSKGRSSSPYVNQTIREILSIN